MIEQHGGVMLPIPLIMRIQYVGAMQANVGSYCSSDVLSKYLTAAQLAG